MLPTVVKVLYGFGAIGLVVDFALFVRMATDLNRILPSQKKIPILELNMRRDQVKRLHEEFFPVSRLRAAWFVLQVASGMTMAAAVVLAVKSM
jgi:hypothetical protein